MNEVYIFDFVVSADVIGFALSPFVNDDIDRTAMVSDIQPIPNVLSIPLNRQGFAQHDVDTHQGYQLYGEMVGAVIIGTIGDDGRHTIGMVVSTGEVVAACFGCRIGAIGGVRGGFGKRVVIRPKRPIDFIGGIVELAIAALATPTIPVIPEAFQEGEGTDDMGANKGIWA